MRDDVASSLIVYRRTWLIYEREYDFVTDIVTYDSVRRTLLSTRKIILAFCLTVDYVVIL